MSLRDHADRGWTQGLAPRVRGLAYWRVIAFEVLALAWVLAAWFVVTALF